ncbi:MAG: DUF922 domain-containing protein [Rhodanobacter sp.]
MMLLLSLWLSASASIPVPVVNEQLQYYAVTGNDAQALRRSLNANGPLVADGKRYDAYTRWKLRWHYHWNSDATGACALVSFDSVTDVQMTLPQWQIPERIPQALRRQWAAYLQALRTHEEGHAQIGRAAADAMDNLMRTFGTRPDCHALDIELQARGKRLLQDFSGKDAEYDLRTQHGMTQGAVFP